VKKSLNSQSHKILLEVIHQARLKAGLTQQELADRLNAPQSFISKYEGGERRLDVVELRNICLCLGIGFQDFIRDFEQRLNETQP
jgi:transcriptional regulator with XRE-family HTH domain